MKFNNELAEQFDITPGQDPPRETVQVDHIPTPVEVADATRGRKQEAVELGSEDRVANIVAEEMDELGTRLEKFGVRFDAGQKQTVVDYAMSVLAGYGGGGAIGRR